MYPRGWIATHTIFGLVSTVRSPCGWLHACVLMHMFDTDITYPTLRTRTRPIACRLCTFKTCHDVHHPQLRGRYFHLVVHATVRVGLDFVEPDVDVGPILRSACSYSNVMHMLTLIVSLSCMMMSMLMLMHMHMLRKC